MIIGKNYLLYFRFSAIIVISLTLFGVIRNYSPVPFMDMWDGYLDFYIQVTEGNWNAWFKQHNEHRTIFSNLFFYIDLHYFGGLSYFLIFINIVLLFITVLTLWYLINDLFQNIEIKYLKEILKLVSVILIFSWIQKENIIWGFQSQFFAAYLLPLVSFYLYIKSTIKTNKFYFIFSLFFAILSSGTMANGILVLPILFLFSLILRDNNFRIITILLITIVVLNLFFYDYKPVAGHGSIFDTIKNIPIDFIKYFFAYLGGIFYPLLGSKIKVIPQLFGIIFCVSILFFIFKFYMRKDLNRYCLVFFSFFLYYLGTAFVTTGGRAVFGIEQAFSSRYMTPTLIAWNLLIILWFYYFFKSNLLKNLKFLLFFLILLSLTITFNQTSILKEDLNENINKKIAILNLKMNIRDEKYLNSIFPFTDWLFQLSKKPMENNISIFNHDDFKDIPNILNSSITLPTKELIGHLDEQNDFNNFIRIRGWVFNKEFLTTPNKLYVVNDEGKIIGYIFSGYERIDVQSIVNEKALKSGFIGYVLKNNLTQDLYLVDTKNNNFALKIRINL